MGNYERRVGAGNHMKAAPWKRYEYPNSSTQLNVQSLFAEEGLMMYLNNRALLELRHPVYVWLM